MMPNSRIDEASYSSDSSSNHVRGWSGFGVICDRLISLIADDPLVWMSSIEIRESRPRPNAFLLGEAI